MLEEFRGGAHHHKKTTKKNHKEIMYRFVASIKLGLHTPSRRCYHREIHRPLASLQYPWKEHYNNRFIYGLHSNEEELRGQSRTFDKNLNPGDQSIQEGMDHNQQSKRGRFAYSGAEFVDLMHYIDERMRIRGYSILKILFSLGAATLLVWMIFRDKIKDAAAQHTADVASRSLSSDNVQDSASNLSKSVIQEILNDAELRNQALLFVTDLMQRPEAVNAAKSFVAQLFNDPYIQSELYKLVGNQANRLLNDDYVRKQVTDLAYYVIMQQATYDAMNNQAQNIIKSETFQESVNNLFMNSIQSERVRKASIDLATYTVGQVLNSEEVNIKVREWVNTLLADEELRMKGGEALWNVVRWGVFPRWWTSGSASDTASLADTASAVAAASTRGTTSNTSKTFAEASARIAPSQPSIAASSAEPLIYDENK